MVAHSAGETFEGITDATGESHAEADRSGGAVFRPHRGVPKIGPGSWNLAPADPPAPAPLPAGGARHRLAATRRHLDRAAQGRISGPSSRRASAPQSGFWAVAAITRPGARRVRPEGRAARVGRRGGRGVVRDPGFYRPVEIGGRRYVDGGMYSIEPRPGPRRGPGPRGLSQPDLVAGPDRAPGTRSRGGARGPRPDVRRLGSEARTLREGGTDLILIQPTADDLEAMGPNLMSAKDRNPVIELARRDRRRAAAGEPARRPARRAARRDAPRRSAVPTARPRAGRRCSSSRAADPALSRARSTPSRAAPLR